MTQRRSGALAVLNDRRPRTGHSATAQQRDLLKVHRQAESDALLEYDPGPVGFDFVLPDDDPGDLLVVSGFTWRGVLRIDGG